MLFGSLACRRFGSLAHSSAIRKGRLRRCSYIFCLFAGLAFWRIAYSTKSANGLMTWYVPSKRLLLGSLAFGLSACHIH
jgi:hypothetical protein